MRWLTASACKLPFSAPPYPGVQQTCGRRKTQRPLTRPRHLEPLHVDLTRTPVECISSPHDQAVDHYPTPTPHRPKGASAMTPRALDREPRLGARLFCSRTQPI